MKEFENDLICENLSVNSKGHLCFAGMDTEKLAAQFGTPLYLMDEDRVRSNCRAFQSAAKAAFGEKYRILFASKAASFKRLYRIMREENMGVDVVSQGEIYTADAAGFPMENAFFHSNNKTDADICAAMDAGVGYFVSDNTEELAALEKEAAKRGVCQKVLLRLTPGIDPHTYEAVATGKVDSKFGFAIETGLADNAVAYALSLPHVKLCGFHSHVGSQVFDSEVFLRAADVMLRFIAHAKEKYAFEALILDLGGGFGVPYIAQNPKPNVGGIIAEIGEKIGSLCKELGIVQPEICFEPGRAIVADAGMTLYTVGSVKTIPGYRTYVSVDGGMGDNIRYALYGSAYTILPALKMREERDLVADVAGRCCESGDILQRKVPLPRSTARGDLLACLTTGAYHYSMASNYNRIPRPPIVMIRGGTPSVAVRRETVEDLVKLDE